MKIAVVDPSLFTPIYDHEFCSALANCGDAVTLIGRPERDHERTANQAYEFKDLFYRRSGQPSSGSRPSFLDRIQKGFEHASGLRSLERLVANRRCDVVHFQWVMLPILDLRALARLRGHCGLVLTVHNSEIGAHDSRSAVGRLGAYLQGLDKQRAVLGFDRFVVHSARSLDMLRALGVDSERVLQIPHPPLTLSVQAPASLPRIQGAPRNILFFGNIKHYKGVDTLIDAGLLLASLRRDFVITIAGKPSLSMREMQLKVIDAGMEDVFHFDLEYIPDTKLATYLAAADIVVFPYRDIDGSGALSHALTFEKPIVASNVGGFAELPFRDHLELVPPDNPAALAAVLRRLLDDSSQLASLAAKTATLKASLPTWHSYAQACRGIYSDLKELRPTDSAE